MKKWLPIIGWSLAASVIVWMMICCAFLDLGYQVKKAMIDASMIAFIVFMFLSSFLFQYKKISKGIPEKNNEAKLFDEIFVELVYHLDCYSRWMFGASLGFCMLASLYYGDCLGISKAVTEHCFDYCPKLIAFGIAAYVFLINYVKNDTRINKDITLPIINHKCKLSSCLFASIIWFILDIFIVLLLAIIVQFVKNGITLGLLYGFIVYSVWLFIDVLMKLYDFHHYIFDIITENNNQNNN